MSNLPLFRLEDYLATREFKAPYMLCASDVETHSMQEILAMADDECHGLWNNLSLGYTEPYGMPALLNEIPNLYGSTVSQENILTFAGAEEGIYCACHALLEPGDHAIVVTPCYQSLESIPASLCSVSSVELKYEENWELDIEKVRASIQPNTKLLLINFPHNPTGTLLTYEQQAELVKLARQHGIWIFSDEVYRLLELDSNDRLPDIASVYEKGLSLSVMSKAFGLAGLRIGWIACQDKNFIKLMSDMKHYLSICNSAPSEVLALIALKNKSKLLGRNLETMRRNIKLFDQFFEDYADLFEWVRPKGGCIGFPKLKSDEKVFDFSEALLNAKGVVTLPNTVYDFSGNHFRIGFGRKNTPEALDLLKEFIHERQSR